MVAHADEEPRAIVGERGGGDLAVERHDLYGAAMLQQPPQEPVAGRGHVLCVERLDRQQQRGVQTADGAGQLREPVRVRLDGGRRSLVRPGVRLTLEVRREPGRDQCQDQHRGEAGGEPAVAMPGGRLALGTFTGGSQLRVDLLLGGVEEVLLDRRGRSGSD